MCVCVVLCMDLCASVLYMYVCVCVCATLRKSKRSLFYCSRELAFTGAYLMSESTVSTTN